MSCISISQQNTDNVRAYLREIGRVPLLTREQEVEYGTQVQRMMPLLEAKETLANVLHREPTVEEWALQVQISETELFGIVRHGLIAKNKMVEANLRLVVAIAKKYQKRNLEFLDLIQSGSIGLERAAEKFDPARGWKFSTYAYWWIRQAMTRALAQQARTIRLPIHITEKLNKIKKAQRQLSQQMGRTATISEVAAALKLTSKQVRDCLEQARLPVSLDLRVGDNQDIELGELLEDTGTSPEEFVMQSSLSDDLERMMAELTLQQREVLALRFGLVNGQTLTLVEIGSRRGISRERVRQIERKALDLLRRHSSVCQEYFSRNVQD